MFLIWPPTARTNPRKLVRRGRVKKKPRSVCPHQRQRSKCKECGGASICQHQRIRSRYKECGGATSARTAHQEQMQGVRGVRASASTSAEGADARSAATRRMSRCRPGWRSSEKVLMALVSSSSAGRERIEAGCEETTALPVSKPRCYHVKNMQSMTCKGCTTSRPGLSRWTTYAIDDTR